MDNNPARQQRREDAQHAGWNKSHSPNPFFCILGCTSFLLAHLYIYIYISYVLSRHSAFILRAAYGQPALCPAFPECASRKSSTRSTRLLARFQVSRPYVPRLWRDSLVRCASLRLLSESWFLTSWCAQKENLRIVANFSLIPTEPKRSPQWAPEKNCIAMFRQRQRL